MKLCRVWRNSNGNPRNVMGDRASGTETKDFFCRVGRKWAGGVASDKNKRQREPLSESDGDDYGSLTAAGLQGEITEDGGEEKATWQKEKTDKSGRLRQRGCCGSVILFTLHTASTF